MTGLHIAVTIVGRAITLVSIYLGTGLPGHMQTSRTSQAGHNHAAETRQQLLSLFYALKGIAKSNGYLIAIPFKSEEEQQLLLLQ